MGADILIGEVFVAVPEDADFECIHGDDPDITGWEFIRLADQMVHAMPPYYMVP
jgi:hypothetical protein